MPDITINGTVVSLPDSAASPNWAPAILQAFTLIEASLNSVSGTFDITPQVFNISAFNTTTNQDITGLTFSNTAVRSAVINYYVFRQATPATNNASESGQIFVDYNANRSANQQWAISQETVGDGKVSFSITDEGQVQFNTTALGGTSHTGFLGFSAKVLEQ